MPIVAGADLTNKNPPEQRLVHLDLKGAPPKVNRTLISFLYSRSNQAVFLLIFVDKLFKASVPNDENSRCDWIIN